MLNDIAACAEGNPHACTYSVAIHASAFFLNAAMLSTDCARRRICNYSWAETRFASCSLLSEWRGLTVDSWYLTSAQSTMKVCPGRNTSQITSKIFWLTALCHELLLSLTKSNLVFYAKSTIAVISGRYWRRGFGERKWNELGRQNLAEQSSCL